MNRSSIQTKKNRKIGQKLKEKLVESKSITGGRLFKAGSVRIGNIVSEIQKENRDNENAVAIGKEAQAMKT